MIDISRTPSSLSDPVTFKPITSSRRRDHATPPPSSQDSGSSASRDISASPHKTEDVQNAGQPQSEEFADQPDYIPLEPSVPAVSLSPEQNTVLQDVRSGKSVFFTGSAGTGKSVLLREIIRIMGGAGSSGLAITASTGIAAVNIGGSTLHSWAGIGLGQDTAKNYAGKFIGQKTFKPVLHRWRAVRCLIIDEVSMLDGRLFDKLENIGRLVRRNEEPFGGIQLVLSGDFCQLPPVPDKNNAHVTFAFEAESWDSCVGRPVTLTKVFRQKDQAFANMLNAMRFGDMKPEMIQVFKSLSRPITYDDGILPTELFPTRREVALANQTRLDALPGKPVVYRANDRPGIDANGRPVSKEAMIRLLERLVAPNEIVLKVDAQVMLIKNLVQGELVNGSVGRVIRFAKVKDVARNAIIKADEKANAKANRKDPSPDDLDCEYPLVRFTNGREMLCVPSEFTVDTATGDVEASRTQVPLIHAWALSMHKSQGQTLERVKVDLRHTFEKGQAYVALSRATNMETLQVLNFNPSRVIAHPRVLAWYTRMDMKRDPHDVEEFSDDDEDAMAAYYD
ncbi:hypothetical protein ONZ45_g17199 [Pleurotus djamor]|nr:hypothetical protein ONZ45_g17199 [Pleurotus djamor]